MVGGGPFEFLHRLQLSPRETPGLGLPPGINPADARTSAGNAGITLPPELEALFALTYGATFGEYRMLTLPEILEATNELRSTYGKAWRDELLPICFLQGGGDYILLDVASQGPDGVAVIDGFHEVEPDRWAVIRHGLAKWLEELVANQFQPYWLGPERPP